MNIRNELINLSEEKYKEFSMKLIPGCTNMLGVRIPIIRKLAKEVIKEDWENYLKEEEKYFEEIMLKGFIINSVKITKEEKFKLIKWYVPKITNWSLCDSFCNSLKIKDNEKEDYWNFIEKYWKSNKPYDIRFAVVTILSDFIIDEYIDKLFSVFDYIENDEYYVQMGVAWAISMCFVKYPDKTMQYLKNNKLDKFTYNKSLQKIVESLAVDKNTKEIIKSMKIK